jgi:hypothetical protein
MERPRVLLLDDGELSRIYVTLRRMGLDPVRVSGDEIQDGLPMPKDLLITTGRRTLSTPELAIAGSRAPTWICVHTQDFHPLRERLRALGVHYLVQSTASDAALALFFSQLLHPGNERRTAPRLPVGCEVRWSWRSRARHKAMLLDLSAQGIRLETADEIPVGARVDIVLPGELMGEETAVTAAAERCDPIDAGVNSTNPADRWDVALLWGQLERSDRQRIEAVAAGRRIGTRITPLQPQRYVDGTGIPDWEAMARAGDRRHSQRHRYQGHVDAFRSAPGTGPIATLGRDLSGRGMRIEPVQDLEVGSDLTVAIHAGDQDEPILLEARVEHRHPDGSLGLAFTLLDARTRSAIAAVLEALPSVALLSADERILPTEISLREG